MAALISWNDYKNDEFSGGSPANAISARNDLIEGGARAAGGIDGKVGSARLVKENNGDGKYTYARTGMTYGGEDVPVFCWSDNKELGLTTAHFGHPDCYENDFVYV